MTIYTDRPIRRPQRHSNPNQISLYLSNEIIDAIDARRGMASRSAYVRMILIDWLDSDEEVIPSIHR